MVSPPKLTDWITPAWTDKIVVQVTGCDLFVGREALEAAVREGLIRSRKVTTRGENRRPKYLELHPKYWDGKDLVRVDFYAGETLEFHQGDLMRWLQPVEDKPARRRGRPAKYDWDAFWIEAVLLPDGLPDTQAEFEQLMAAWFEKETGDSPSISQIRERAAKLYAQKADK